MSDNVKVSIKVRPLIKRERDSKLSSQWRIRDNTIAAIDGNGDPFIFDHIFDEHVGTRELFETVCRPVVLSALNGINGTIFAYGQTSSGKTHTMIGHDEEPGVVPLTAREIFEQIKKIKERQFLIRVGFIEIYNEKIHDLLNPAAPYLKIQENQCGEGVVNSKENITNCPEQIIQHVDEGNKVRKISETNMNDRSSRSHTIFRITIESRVIGGETDNEAVQIGILNLVDLAGSERADQTGVTGSRLKEGSFINRSLLSLSCVIQKLSENSDNQFINYRDSKLTRILQASLGGNAVTSMICNITPAALDETYYTLSFAMRAKKIKNKPKVNEILTGAAMMKRLEKEIKRLQGELRLEQNKNSKIKMVELQDAITLRTNSIINPNKMLSAITENARRRTWCPSNSEIPRLHNNARPLSQASEERTLMGPPSAPAPYLVSMNGMTPNIAIRMDDDQPNQVNGFGATLALMGDDEQQAAYRNLLDSRVLLSRQVRSSSPTDYGLLNPFSIDGEEFVPGEQISFGHNSLSPLSIIARDLHTPQSLRRIRRSSTGDSPTNMDYEKRCRVLEQELTELQEFTRLEKSVELEYLKKELAERDHLLAGLEQKEQRMQQLEERCTHLEIELKDQKAQVGATETKLALAVTERATALQKAQYLNNQFTSIEFEFERYRQRSEARQLELIESLQEARGSSGTVSPNKADSFRLDQNRGEMKRLEMQNYEFTLQLEERNKQIEQLKTSYFEQHRKLEQVKQTVLQHHRPIAAVAGNKGEDITTQSLVQSLHKLLLLREDAENGEYVSQQNGVVQESFSESASSNHTNRHDANATIIGEEQTIQELLKIIETLEQSLKTVQQEKTTQAQSNGVMLNELNSKFDAKIRTVEQLEKQLKQWQDKFEAQTNEYDEMSTQLMDQMQENEDLRKAHEKVTISKDEVDLLCATLQGEIVGLKKTIEEKALLVEMLEQEKKELTAKCDDITESLGSLISRKDELETETKELKVKLETNVKDKMDKLRQELTTHVVGLKSSIDELMSENVALSKDNARLLGQLENLQEKQLQETHVSDRQNSELQEILQAQKDDFAQHLQKLEDNMEALEMELRVVQTNRDQQLHLFSSEKETFEKTNQALQLEVDRLQELLHLLEAEKHTIINTKEIEDPKQDYSEPIALLAELQSAKQCQGTHEERIRELQEEVVRYRKDLATSQDEYAAYVEMEETEKETYQAAQQKLAEEIELSKKIIVQLKEELTIASKHEANTREEVDKVKKCIVELKDELQRKIKNLEVARMDHTALLEKQGEERETASKTIELLNAENDALRKQQFDDRQEQESLLERLEELIKGKESLEKQFNEKEVEIGIHISALEAVRKEHEALAEQQRLDCASYETAQQKLLDEMYLLKTTVERLTEEKEGLTKEQAESIVRQQSLEKQLHDLSLTTRQLEHKEKEIFAKSLAEHMRLVEQQNVVRKELEDKNVALAKELDSLQYTVEQLMAENESLLKEQLESEDSRKQRSTSEAEELEKLRTCSDESERLVAQLEHDLRTVRDELETVRSELLAEKRRHDESEQSVKGRVQSMTEEIERLKCSIVALEDEKERLQHAESRLLTHLKENERRSSELEKKQQEMESFREELRKENSDLTVAVQELSAKIVNLEEQMDGNEAAQRKTIDALVREKQAQEEIAQQHEQDAIAIRHELTKAGEKLAELEKRNDKILGELNDVKTALDACIAERSRLEADIQESASVRDVLERELRELKNDLESLDSKLTKERYEQELQVSADLRRELNEKQKELESFMATGRPSLGDGRVVQALRRENEDLLKQLNEARQTDGLKGKQLQDRVDELQRLETQIASLRDEMATMRHESSFNEKEAQITQLRHRVIEVEKVREETVHQKRSLEREFDQLRFKNQTLAKEVDELRRMTDKERRSKRQSTHDDRRGLLFNSKEVSTMTDPTSTNCSCLDMDAQIKELRNKLTLKDCQLNTQKLISSANPLKNEITEMRRKLEEHNRAKAQLEHELREVLAVLDKERKERKRHCTQCIRHSRKQNALCDKAVQAYHPDESAAAVSVSIVSTSLATTVTPSRSAQRDETNVVTTLQNRCDEHQEKYEQLEQKYQTMKQLCRLRNEKIVSLSQSIAEKENDNTNLNRDMQHEYIKLKQQLKEAENRYAQIYHTSQIGGKMTIKSEAGVQTDIDLFQDEMYMYRTKYEKYKALAQKLLDDASKAKKNGQRSSAVQ